MANGTIYALPVHSRPHRPAQVRQHQKRKRGVQNSGPAAQLEDQGIEQSFSLTSTIAEYSAVVTPTERSQRRLAGLSIDQNPPSKPFPHRAQPNKEVKLSSSHKRTVHSVRSLHLQHLAVVTTILHRTVMAHDWQRASRALGLLLRNEVGGHDIDIRAEGLWGIGAEILFRRETQQASSIDQDTQITREGFERAKRYYELLIIQYPPSRTWPSSVNARDFSIALFGLWVYVVQAEGRNQQNDAKRELHHEDHEASHFDTKLWELGQAENIGAAMDAQMSRVPYSDDSELIRLRGMVALWTADLCETCDQLEVDHALYNTFSDDDVDNQDLSENIERVQNRTAFKPEARPSRDQAAQQLRALAERMFDKLGTA